jgi:hypothetical protein
MAKVDNLEREEREALKALDEIARSAQQFSAFAALPAAGTVRQGAREADLDLPSVDPAKLCQEYTRLKPSIEFVLAFVARIPIYGSKIVAVIRFLMGIADTVCPVI